MLWHRGNEVLLASERRAFVHTRAHAMTEQEKRAAILDENSVTQRTSPVRALGPSAAAGPGAVLLPRSALGTLGLVGGVLRVSFCMVFELSKY